MKNKDVEELEKKVDGLSTILAEQNIAFNNFVNGLKTSFEEIKAQGEKNNNWLKEFNRLALAEYMGGPKKKVYAFIYERHTEPRENRIIMAARDTFEEAHEAAKNSLQKQGENVELDWTMSAYKSIDVPRGTPEIIDGLEKKMPFEKPIDVYLHELSLARDRFATSAEKRSFNSVMKRIKKQYDAK